MTHLSDTELAELVDSSSQHVHLDQCSSCRERLTQLGALARTFRGEAVSDPSAVHIIMNRVNRRRPSRLRFALAGLAAAALVLFIALRQDGAEHLPTLAARGGDSAGALVTTFVHAPASAPRVPLTPGLSVGRDFALSFRALAPRTPTHLMVATCDAARVLHWAVPVWADASLDPHGVLLDPTVPLLDLPVLLQPEAPPGPLAVLVITSPQPITVQAVERAVAEVHCDGPAIARRLGADVSTTTLNLR